MKRLGSILFLLSACTASVEDPTHGDDDGGPGAGNDTVRFRLTTIHDERGDTLDWATGEPVHTHAGPTVQLGGETCTVVFKHAYLMDATAPKFGRETSQNALAWNIEADGPAEYRVRGAGDATVVDWTAVEGSTIALYRDAVANGSYFLDVRVGEAVATTCFDLHLLAAPLEVQAAQADATGLAGMTFAAASPFSQLLGDQTSTRAFVQRFVHHTAEPVTLVVDLVKPAGTFTRRAVDDFVVARTSKTNILCSRDSDGFVSGDPLCTDITEVPDPADRSDTAALTSGTWTLAIIDEATGAAANCSVSALRATCQLAPRATTEASKAYRIQLAVSGLTDLQPSTAGPYAEHTIENKTFTGRLLETVQRCGVFFETTKLGVTIVTCNQIVEYTRIHALDQVRIAFEPVPFALSTSTNATLPAAPIASPGVPAYVWDAGDADLPGPQ